MTQKTRSPSTSEVALVTYLLTLARGENRGALAALRTGLGKEPGEAPRMLPYVARFISDDGSSVYTQSAFVTASLFATHPSHAEIGSLGESLKKSTNLKHGEAGVERRFAAALDADPEDLAHHLRALVSLCESAGAAINWHQFFWDVSTLLSEDEEKRNRVRTKWARDFWGNSDKPNDAPSTNPTEDSNE